MKKLFILCVILFALSCAGVAMASPLPGSSSGQVQVNVNSATVEQLKQLPQIGEVTAQRIVDYRTDHGAFTSVDDLTKVKGIGSKTLDKLQGLVTLQ